MIFTSTIANSLKETLNTIVDDKTDGVMDNLYIDKWMQVDGMDDEFVDDLEMGGPGLAQQKSEGAAITLGSIAEGVLTRYLARTFALQLTISHEAMRGGKYAKAINLAKRLKRAMAKTADIDGTNRIARGWNASYTIGDSLPVFSTAHLLPGGAGTFSNTLATPMTASRAALIVVSNALGILVGHDGVVEGYDIKAVVCPRAQKWVWRGIIGSAHAPEPGQFNEINVVNSDINPDLVSIPYWTSSTTNWAVVTSAPDGASFKWREKPFSSTWVENSQLAMNYAIAASWDHNVSDPRGLYGSQA